MNLVQMASRHSFCYSRITLTLRVDGGNYLLAGSDILGRQWSIGRRVWDEGR